MMISKLLEMTLARGASDLHLAAGERPWHRNNGDMNGIDEQPTLSSEEIQRAVFPLLSEEKQTQYLQGKSCNVAVEIPELGRFRVNVFQQTNGMAAAFRPVARKAQTLAQIKAPENLAKIACAPRGLVLVTGITGSGKSTTQAAMIDHLNTSLRKHIITLEDPIETMHESDRCLIQQREVGKDTLSFSDGLKDALREDPDVILVGELRDLETMRLACSAAETGHLVLATLHTMSASKTIDRFIDVFPESEKSIVRTMLSESLHAVISQVLVKRTDGMGRVAAHEIMLGTPAIRNLIREGKTQQMNNVIMTGSGQGMITMDQSLQKMVRSKLIDVGEARSVAYDPEQFH